MRPLLLTVDGTISRACPGTGILTKTSRGEGGYLINREREHYLKGYLLEQDGAGFPRHDLALASKAQIEWAGILVE